MNVTIVRLLSFAEHSFFLRLRMAWRVLTGGTLAVDLQLPVVPIPVAADPSSTQPPGLA